jgi:hypothetical protein
VRDEQQILRAFLATRGVPCPACGYDLHGVESGACPECGETLGLSLRPPDGLGRRRGLLVLLFTWLLLAGAMNEYRAVHAIHRTATGWGQQIAMINVSSWSPAPPASLSEGEAVEDDDAATTLAAVESALADAETSLGNETGPAGAEPPDSGTLARIVADLEGEAVDAAVVTMRSRLDAGSAFAPSAIPSGPRWGAVRWTQWAAAGWWLVLALVAAAALVLLAIHRRRSLGAAAVRALTSAAWLAFGGYFAYHLVGFAREIV